MSVSGLAIQAANNSNVGRHICAIVALLLIAACVHKPVDPRAAIHEAVKSHDLAKVLQLVEVEVDADLMLATDAKGNRPLHWAAFLGHKDIILYLIEAGSDVNARTGLGRHLSTLPHSPPLTIFQSWSFCSVGEQTLTPIPPYPRRPSSRQQPRVTRALRSFC